MDGYQQLLQSAKTQDDDEVRRLEATLREKKAAVKKKQEETSANKAELQELNEQHAKLTREDGELQAQAAEAKAQAKEAEESMNRSYGEFTLLCEQLRQEQSQRKVWELELAEVAPFIADRLHKMLTEAEQDERKLVREMEHAIDTCCDDDDDDDDDDETDSPRPPPAPRPSCSCSSR